MGRYTGVFFFEKRSRKRKAGGEGGGGGGVGGGVGEKSDVDTRGEGGGGGEVAEVVVALKNRCVGKGFSSGFVSFHLKKRKEGKQKTK